MSTRERERVRARRRGLTRSGVRGCSSATTSSGADAWVGPVVAVAVAAVAAVAAALAPTVAGPVLGAAAASAAEAVAVAAVVVAAAGLCYPLPEFMMVEVEKQLQ